MTASDCRRRSEIEEKKLRANSGLLFMTRSMAALWMLATLDSVTASANTSCQRPSTRFSLPKRPPSLRKAMVASCGLLVVAVHLVQSHRPRDEKVELVVGISRGKDDVLLSESPLDHPEAHPLEVLEVETLGRASRGESPGIMLGKHLTGSTPLGSRRAPARLRVRLDYDYMKVPVFQVVNRCPGAP
jgi:hypothetical protein